MMILVIMIIQFQLDSRLFDGKQVLHIYMCVCMYLSIYLYIDG